MKHAGYRPLVIERVLEDAQGAGLQGDGRLQDAPTVAPMVSVLRQGLPFAEFECLAGFYGLTEEAMAAALDIPRATLHRRKKAGVLPKDESERVVRLARVYAQAMALFEEEAGAREWLKTPAVGLNGETPLQYMDTEAGAREVENLLGRIAHGVFA